MFWPPPATTGEGVPREAPGAGSLRVVRDQAPSAASAPQSAPFRGNDMAPATESSRRTLLAGVACPERHRKTWLRIRAILKDMPLDQELDTEAAWDDFVVLWEGMTKEVTNAHKAWIAIGQPLAAARLAAKSYDAVEYEPPDDGTKMPDPRNPVPAWSRPQHPDEYWAVQVVFNAGKNMQENRIVRLPPGSDARLDAARADYKSWLAMREQALREFLGSHAHRSR